MEKKTAGLIGAIAGLATLGAVQASAQPAASPLDAFHVASYADLLTPIQNAAEQLHADDAVRVSESADRQSNRRQSEETAGEQLLRVQYAEHHHHHHRPPPRRHHHHHHHHSAYFAAPSPAGSVGSVKQV